MKKSILGSTALVAVGAMAAVPAHADDWEVSIGGYFNTYFSVGVIDEASDNPADYNSTGLFSDGEIHFNFSYLADNGIVFGATVELEAQSQGGGDQMDENYIFVEGSFGRIVAGSVNSAAYQMHYAAPYAGLPINSGWVTVFIPVPAGQYTGFEHPGLSTYIDFGDDDNSITYYSPRIAGFQFGVTYAPTIVSDGEGKNYPVEADRETEYHNGVSVGLNFVEDFDGFGVAASAGWRYAQAPDSAKAVPTIDDYGAYSLGLQLSYAGFTVGGSYANEYSGWYDGGVGSTEGEGWDVGVTYGLGPWTFGATYFAGEVGGVIPGIGIPGADSTNYLDTATIGATYALGPGITLSAGIIWAEWNPEFGKTQSGVTGAAGLSFSF